MSDSEELARFYIRWLTAEIALRKIEWIICPVNQSNGYKNTLVVQQLKSALTLSSATTDKQ